MRPKLNLKSKSQMPLSHEHVGSKILAKIKIYVLTRAELLFNLCYEIPCSHWRGFLTFIQISHAVQGVQINRTRAIITHF